MGRGGAVGSWMARSAVVVGGEVGSRLCVRNGFVGGTSMGNTSVGSGGPVGLQFHVLGRVVVFVRFRAGNDVPNAVTRISKLANGPGGNNMSFGAGLVGANVFGWCPKFMHG